MKNTFLFVAVFTAAMTSVPASAAPVQKTVTGVFLSGSLDSCFEVTSGDKQTCYGFIQNGTVHRKLGSICGHGDTCKVTGTFDDETKDLLSVKKVVNVTK